MRKRLAVILAVTVSLALNFITTAVFPNLAAADEPFIIAESEGIGLTRNEALFDARRNAVQQAVGVVSTGITEVIDDRVRENVVQLSRAFIERFDILSEGLDGGRWQVRIRAWVRRENLLSGLLQKSPDTSPFDGAGLFTRALTREQQIQEAAEMLIEFFGTFPYENYVYVGVGAGDLQFGAEQVTLDVRFSFDRERYFAEAVPMFATILDYVAEATVRDIPFVFSYLPQTPIQIAPPSGMNTLAQYKELMEVQGGNRYLDIPGIGAFANIYLLRRNFYFDAYRVPAESFAILMENLLETQNNRLTGRMFDGADLRIAFRSSGGHLVKEHVEPLHLHNVMLFTSLDGLERAPYVLDQPGRLNEQHHALFILPSIGVLGRGASDYILIKNETAPISVAMSPSDLQLISQATCIIEMRRPHTNLK